jgi:hypothetical protein
MLNIFGDSHSQILGGGVVLSSEFHNKEANRFKSIKVHWLSGALAFNLIDDDENLLKWGSEIVETLEKASDVSSILLAFGEIDIRVHVIKRAFSSNKHPYVVNEVVAERLMRFSEYLFQKFNIPIFVLSPIPSAPNFKGFNKDLPNTGSERERNYLTYKFSEFLENWDKKQNQIYIINLFNYLTDRTLNTNVEFYADSIHLNLKGFDLFVREFESIVDEKNLKLKKYYSITELKYLDEIIEKDITKSCNLIKQSSSYMGSDSLVNKVNSNNFIFHTQLESNPYIVIDIGYIAPLTKIKIYNRKGFEERCQNFMLSVSNQVADGYISVFETSEIFGLDGNPLEVDVKDFLGKIRFIKMELKSENMFHLDRVEIIERSFLG